MPKFSLPLCWFLSFIPPRYPSLSYFFPRRLTCIDCINCFLVLWLLHEHNYLNPCSKIGRVNGQKLVTCPNEARWQEPRRSEMEWAGAQRKLMLGKHLQSKWRDTQDNVHKAAAVFDMVCVLIHRASKSFYRRKRRAVPWVLSNKS